MWRHDGDLCFLQVKELNAEQPGERFLPLHLLLGGARSGRRRVAVGRVVCFATGTAWQGSHLTRCPGLAGWRAGNPRLPISLPYSSAALPGVD